MKPAPLSAMPLSCSTAFQWLSLVGIIWLQSVNGTNTNFPAYSSQLKQVLNMSQLQLNNLAFASDAGKLFGFISGFAALYLPLWLVLLIGSTLGLVGYGLQYLFITNHISSPSYVYIFLFTVLAGNSICWINTVCYVVAIRNFPSDRQVAVGLTTSYQGLSAKIYTVNVDALFVSTIPAKRAKAYLLLNSLLPLLISVVTAPVVRDINAENGKNMRGEFILMFVITIATGIFAVISSLGSRATGLSNLASAVGILAFLLAPLVIPLAEKVGRRVLVRKSVLSRETKVYDVTEEENNVDVEIVENGVRDGDNVDGKSDEVNEEVGVVFSEEIGVKLMLKKVEFWLYFFVYFCGATLGLVYLNNLGQIAESRGCSKTSSLVSLSSAMGFFGRLMPSLVDYFCPRSRYIIPGPASVAASMAPMAGAFWLLLHPTNTNLYISTAIIGLCTGAITSISVSITTELFGTKNFSVNHNVVVANIPIGSFVFGYLAAFVYRKESNGDGKCMGMQCYRNTFVLWGSLCFFGTFLALVLYARTRKFYLLSRKP